MDKLPATDLILAGPDMTHDPHHVFVREVARLEATKADGIVCTRLGGLGERAG